METISQETQIVTTTCEEVRRRFSGLDDLAHGWEHVQRVYHLALWLAEEEKADRVIVGMAARIHYLGLAIRTIPPITSRATTPISRLNWRANCSSPGRFPMGSSRPFYTPSPPTASAAISSHKRSKPVLCATPTGSTRWGLLVSCAWPSPAPCAATRRRAPTTPTTPSRSSTPSTTNATCSTTFTPNCSNSAIPSSLPADVPLPASVPPLCMPIWNN